MVARCDNCAFFAIERGDLCVRFPPPQQAVVRAMDWCGEWEPFEAVKPPVVVEKKPTTVTLAKKPAAALKSFTDLADRL